MIRRRDQDRADLRQAAQRTEASRRQAEEELDRARRKAAADTALAKRLAELNASNGFVELLVDAVVRGTT